MDVSQALKDAENSLRDFIANKLASTLGDDWVAKCGVTEERVNEWKRRKEVEEKKQETGVVEERPLYFADFYDLKTILFKRWDPDFKDVFGKRKELEVWLDVLEGMRNTDAHRRELLPHQKHLVMGVSGEIRSRIVRYRSKMETGEGYFPRIESVRDSLGNMISGSDPDMHTKATLRVGDEIQFVITASDPQGDTLEYRLFFLFFDDNPWQSDNTISLRLTNEMIAESCSLYLQIRSTRPYHAMHSYDDSKRFTYCILPAK